MSKKKNPAAVLAGVVAAALGVAIIAVAALAVAGVIKIDRPASSGSVESSSSDSQQAAIEEESGALGENAVQPEGTFLAEWGVFSVYLPEESILAEYGEKITVKGNALCAGGDSAAELAK